MCPLVPEFSPIPAKRFFAENPRRRGSAQWDHGFFLSEDEKRGMQLTWIEATGEVCALIGAGRYPEAFILLGTAPSYTAMEAVLVDPPGNHASIRWVADMLQRIPGEDKDVRALVADYEARLQEEAEKVEREALASFEIIELSELPDTEEQEAERYAGENWPAIARIAVELLETGVSPRDDEAILARGRPELTKDGCGLLRSLFCDPIAIPKEASAFINGRHRTAAMRAAGVKRCVVDTDRGRQ
jgi:hypothetical protein